MGWTNILCKVTYVSYLILILQVTLSKSLPHGLEIQLPGDWLILEPETCYCLTMSWTPMQPIALRETIHFTNEKRGRYDVIVILKSVMVIFEFGDNDDEGCSYIFLEIIYGQCCKILHLFIDVILVPRCNYNLEFNWFYSTWSSISKHDYS